MKFTSEFRASTAARALLPAIAAKADQIGATCAKPVQIMEISGGHTHSIFRYGLDKLIHEGVEFIHGPGCPVCVLPMARVDECVDIAEQPGVILTTFGDAMRARPLQKPDAGQIRRSAWSTRPSTRWNWHDGTPTGRSFSSAWGSRPPPPPPRSPSSKPRARG